MGKKVSSEIVKIFHLLLLSSPSASAHSHPMRSSAVKFGDQIWTKPKTHIQIPEAKAQFIPINFRSCGQWNGLIRHKSCRSLIGHGHGGEPEAVIRFELDRIFVFWRSKIETEDQMRSENLRLTNKVQVMPRRISWRAVFDLEKLVRVGAVISFKAPSSDLLSAG